MSRSFAIHKNYHAPIDTYIQLMNIDAAAGGSGNEKVKNLCVGKEWYRFPSSFFLPDKFWKLRFIRSEFGGQLPRPFAAPFLNGTRVIQDGFNDRNVEGEGQFFVRKVLEVFRE